MNQLNYHHLYYFYTIAKAGTISKACEILHLSQPALSAQLKTFERLLKRSLFERHKKRLHLTEDGRMVLDYAERIFDLGHQLQDTLRDRLPSGRQSVQVGVMSGTPRALSDALVAHILKHSPTAHIVIEEKPLEQLMGLLANLNLDLLLTDTPVSDPAGIDFTSHRVGRIPVVFAAHSKRVATYVAALKNKTPLPVILSTAPNMPYQQVKDFLSGGGVAARIVAEVQDMSVAGRLACDGHGAAAISAYLLQRSPYRECLRILELTTPEPMYENIYVVTRNRQYPNPLAAHVVNTFRLAEKPLR